MADDVPAVLNAVRLLERIVLGWPEPVASGTLVEDTAVNRSACYNILGTLHRAGWTASRGDRAGWAPGPRLLAFARACDDWISVVVREELDVLSRRLGLMALALRRQGPDAYAVCAKGDRGRGVRITVDVGQVFPFSSPAIMRSFHAWSDPARFDALADEYGIEAFTPQTVTSRPELHEILRITRGRGYAVSTREFTTDRSEVAAPVFDHRGRVVMVVHTLAFASGLETGDVRRIGTLVRDCGLRISERTGGVEPYGAAEAVADRAESGRFVRLSG